MSLGDGLFLGAVVLVIVGFFALLIHGITRADAQATWCTRRHLISTGGGHSPVLCYDERSRVVYKPR